MLRGDAEAFVPSPPGFGCLDAVHSGETWGDLTSAEMDVNKSDLAAYYEELCSTAAPSPELIAQFVNSPWTPPWQPPPLGFADFGLLPDSLTSPELLAQEFDYMNCCPGLDFDALANPDFLLPESEAGIFAPDIELIDKDASESADFKLNGVDAFQDMMAGLLAEGVEDFALPPGLLQDEKGDDSSNDVAVSDEAPVPAPPPGLEPPPGSPFLNYVNATRKNSSDIDEEETTDASSNELNPGAKEFIMPGKKKSESEKKKSTESPLPKGSTTAMLRNIPNKYTRDMLVEQIHENGFKGQLDFLYLPVDFKNKCNVGYVFLNFRSAEACSRFVEEFHDVSAKKKLPGFNSYKVCVVSPARVQGCDANVRRLQSSPVMVQLASKTEWLPVLLDEHGEPYDFPVPKEAAAAAARETKLASPDKAKRSAPATRYRDRHQ